MYSKTDYKIILEKNECEYNFIDIDINKNEIIEKGIKIFLKEKKLNLTEIFSNRIILKELIKYLNNTEKVKYVEISGYLGISRGTMDTLKK